MNVVTVAFYCSWSVVIFVFISDPYNHIDRQRTTALGAIKGDKPSLAAAATASQINVALVNNTENGIVLLLGENAVLKNKLSALHTPAQTERKTGRQTETQ